MAREQRPLPADDGRSTTEILTEIVDHAQEIIRSEIRLAKVEAREEISKAAKAGGMIAAGGVIALYGIGFLIAFVVWAVALAIPAWASALCVGSFLTIVGIAVLSAGRKRMRHVHPTPERIMQSLREDAKWLKRQAG